jgi:hypothetical protein
MIGFVCAAAATASSAPSSLADQTGSCPASELFQAAVTKEGFNPNDPSYAGFGQYGNDPGAYGVQCDDEWAVALVSRPNVGTTDGETLFREASSVWQEVAQLGPAVAECNLEPDGVPHVVAQVLAHGVKGAGVLGCDSPDAFRGARAEWKMAVCESEAQHSSDWVQAAYELKQAQPAYAGHTASYKRAIRELKKIASLPDTDVTPAQAAEYTTGIKGLDAFFHTPSLYLTYFGHCDLSR